MIKKKAYEFFGTMDDIIDLIKNLPPAPTQAWLQDWKEFIIEKAIGHTDKREFYHEKTKLRACFDLKKEGAPALKIIPKKDEET